MRLDSQTALRNAQRACSAKKPPDKRWLTRRQGLGILAVYLAVALLMPV